MKKVSVVILWILLLLTGHAHAATKRRCPEKVLETATVEGTYQGTSCGDFCYSSIKLGSGEDFIMFCGEEMAEKFFGKPGQRVTATYEVQQFWNELGNEYTRAEVCTGGTILRSQSLALAASQSLAGKYFFRNADAEGTLTLKLNNNTEVRYTLELTSTNLPSASGLCEASMSCANTNNTLTCKGEESTLGYTGTIVGKIINNPLQIEIIEFPSDLCGAGAAMAHTYKKIQ